MSAPAELVLERPPVDWERHRGNGSPKILPPPGETWRNERGRKVGHRYYTRVTTYADALSEQYQLTAWKLRRLALGLGRRSDYVRLAAALTDGDHDRDALDELVEKALEAAGPNAADLGTALHALSERVDYGEELGEIPVEIVPDLAAYVAITDGTVRHALREVRVVCDQLETAGTPDAISYVLAEPCPAGCGPEVLHVGDTKTGSIRYPGKMSTQLAIYSRSDRYDPATGERHPLEVCRSWGFITHVPVETGRGALFWLDLEHGWRGAELCGPVREWRKAKADDILRPFATVQPVEVREGGEVVRVEPRLASTNTKAPAPPTELPDLTEIKLETPRGPHEAPVEDEPEIDEAPDDAGPDLGVEADLAAARGEGVAGTEPRYDEATLAAITAPVPALPDSCAHSGPGMYVGEAPERRRVCADCGEPVRDPVRNPLAVRCPTTELLVEACACPMHRPDLAGTESAPATSSTVHEVPGGAVEILTGPEVDAVVDEVFEQLASGPDSDAEDEPEPHAWVASEHSVSDLCAAMVMRGGGGDQCGLERAHPVHAVEPDELPVIADPITLAIDRCVTTRDLELLSSTAWRSWGPEHRERAREQYERLEAAEAAARPRAAFEAAVAAAKSRRELLEIMNAADGQPWLDDQLVELTSTRWREIGVAS